jgi:hypothetical protein
MWRTEDRCSDSCADERWLRRPRPQRPRSSNEEASGLAGRLHAQADPLNRGTNDNGAF